MLILTMFESITKQAWMCSEYSLRSKRCMMKRRDVWFWVLWHCHCVPAPLWKRSKLNTINGCLDRETRMKEGGELSCIDIIRGSQRSSACLTAKRRVKSLEPGESSNSREEVRPPSSKITTAETRCVQTANACSDWLRKGQKSCEVLLLRHRC